MMYCAAKKFEFTIILLRAQQGCNVSCPLLGKAKIVAFFHWKFRSFAFGKMQKIGCKIPMVSCPFYHGVLPALRAANFHIAGQKMACTLANPWSAAARRAQNSEWSG